MGKVGPEIIVVLVIVERDYEIFRKTERVNRFLCREHRTDKHEKEQSEKKIRLHLRKRPSRSTTTYLFTQLQ